MRHAIFIILLFFIAPLAAQAQSSGGTMAFSLPTSFDEVIQKLPRPLVDFVNSLYQFSIHPGAGSALPMPNSPWMPPYGIPAIPQNLTAGSVFDFVKQLILFIGGFLVVILRAIASVIEWVISIISQRFSS